MIDEVAVHDATGRYGRAAVAAGRAAAALDAPLLNASQLFTVLWRAGDIPAASWPAPAGVAAARDHLEGARRLLVGAAPSAGDGRLCVAELEHGIRLALLGADVLDLGRGGLHRLDPGGAAALRDRLDGLIAEQRALWLLRSRPGGLDDSISRLRPLRRVLERRAAAADAG